MDLAANVTADAAPYTRYLSAYIVSAKDRPDFRRAFRHELNKRNAGRSLVREVEIDGPRGTVAHTEECSLIRIDTRDAPNWTRTAWVLVADRDYIFREAPLGFLPHRETVFGRLVCGIEQNEKTLAAGFVLNAQQLFRDLIELDRNSTSFDLLYAHERHPDADSGKIEFKEFGAVGPEPAIPAGRPWVGGVWPADGKYYAAGSFQWQTPEELAAYNVARREWEARKAKASDALKTGSVFLPTRPVSVRDAGKGDPKFPKTLKDFQRRWGGGTRQAKLKEFLFDPIVGGIALSSNSDEKNGSVVAVGGDRGIEIEETGDGAVMTTRDSFKSVDGNDQIERDNFVNLAKGLPKFDGGEALANLPNGSQAEYLFDEKEEGAEKVTIANTRLAQHLVFKADPRFRDVRVGFCASCHAANEGYNSFVEQFREAKGIGIKFNVQPDDEQRVRDFFMSWDRRVKRWRLPYADYIETTTADSVTGKAWTGAQTWNSVMRFRDDYDRPVTLATAAREFGMPMETLRWAILKDKEAKGPPETRLNQLALGKAIPRQTWEANVAGKLALWMDLTQPVRDPLKTLIEPAILEDAVKRLNYKGAGK